MKNFWPRRLKAKGFSIQNLRGSFRLNTSIPNLSSEELLNQMQCDNNFISLEDQDKKVSIADISPRRIHWANRDFSEYKEAA